MTASRDPKARPSVNPMTLRARSWAVVRPVALPGQSDDPLGVVVSLVALPDVVLRIGPVNVRETAVQTCDVDPLLIVGRGIDVGPTDRGPERNLLLARVLAAAVEHAVPRRALSRLRVKQVAQAVIDLWPRPDELHAVARGVDRPELEARRVA